MKLWEEFYDYTKVFLPGIPELLMDQCLRSAAIEFFKQTETMTAVEILPLVANQSIYITDNPPLTDTARVLELELTTGQKLHPITRVELQTKTYAWSAQVGEPTHFLQLSPRQIRMFPIPENAGQARISMVLQPTRDSVGVEDEYFDEYVEMIAHGAISRAAGVPQKPWTNLELANAMGIAFQADIRNSKIEATRSFTNANLQVEFNRIV